MAPTTQRLAFFHFLLEALIVPTPDPVTDLLPRIDVVDLKLFCGVTAGTFEAGHALLTASFYPLALVFPLTTCVFVWHGQIVHAWSD